MIIIINSSNIITFLSFYCKIMIIIIVIIIITIVIIIIIFGYHIPRVLHSDI